VPDALPTAVRDAARALGDAGFPCAPLVAAAVGAGIRRAVRHAVRRDAPFRHLLLSGVLSEAAARGLAALPGEPAGDVGGRRETRNESRVFLDPAAQARFPAAAAVAGAMQDPRTVSAIAAATGADPAGASLRIEYCRDASGFWLEPHTDIGAKRLTLLVYLSDDPGAPDWGTDLYAGPDGPYAGRAPAAFGDGFAFVPGPDTWHGFEPRAIRGVRRMLMVNWVGPEWRAAGELAFPGRPLSPA